MFENVLKGTKVRKGTGMRAFGPKDTRRWKKEGSVQNMTDFGGYKKKKWWR